MESCIERIGQNIREAGMLDKRGEKSENQSDYGIKQTEAAAGTAAHTAYVLGRKMAEKQSKYSFEAYSISETKKQITEEDFDEAATRSDIGEPRHIEPQQFVNQHVEAAEHLENKKPEYRRPETIRERENISPAKEEVKTKRAGAVVKENEPGQLKNPDYKAVRERQTYTDKSGLNFGKADKSVITQKQYPIAVMHNEAEIKTLNKGSVKTKEIVRHRLDTADNEDVANTPIVKQNPAVRGNLNCPPDIKTRKSYVNAEKVTEDNIKLQAAKVRLEQGRKVAKRNLSASHKAQGNGSEVWEEANAASVDLPAQNIKPNLRNEAGQPGVGAGVKYLYHQSETVNIKSRENTRNDSLPINTVWEKGLSRSKLFGKERYNDVKRVENSVVQSGIKAGLAGIKEKTAPEKAPLAKPKTEVATLYKEVKYNAFGYFDSKHNNAQHKRIEKFVRRFIPNNAKEMLAAIMGMGSVLAVVIIICLIASLFASPFGIFFSGADTMSNAVAELNAEFSQRIEEIKAANSYDELVMNNAMAANWPDVLAVYALLTTMNDSNPYEAVTLDAVKKARLREVFRAMNGISYEVQTVYNPEIEAETEVLYITITEKDCWQLADEYNFTSEQRQLLAELKKPEYQEMFMALVGSYQDIALTPEEIEAIIANLPADLSEARRQAVLTAYQLEGKVNYFWGGKSLTLGWDSRWGTPQEVWAAGSVTTGTVRPFGLDCSGFVDWIFYNASGGSFIMGKGGGAASQHSYCTAISWPEANPGDLVFYPDDSHVGMVCGFDSRGNVQIIHCAAGYNNVVVTGKSGFTHIGRPDYFTD